MHISEATEDLFGLIFLNIFAERTVALLHVSELVFILYKEPLAVLALADSNVRHHVFVVLLGITGVESTHVDDEDFLVSHVLEVALSNLDRPVAIGRQLVVHELEHTLGEEIVFQLVLAIKLKSLLILTFVFFPASCTTFLSQTSEVFWGIHLQIGQHGLIRKVLLGDELHKWKGVKTTKVSDEGASTNDAVVAAKVDQGVSVHAPVADHSEPFFVSVGLRPDLQVLHFDLIRPVVRALESRHLLKAEPGSLKCLELEAQGRQGVINIDLVDAHWSSLSDVTAQEARGIEDSLVVEGSLNQGPVALFDVSVDKGVSLVDLCQLQVLGVVCVILPLICGVFLSGLLGEGKRLC